MKVLNFRNLKVFPIFIKHFLLYISFFLTSSCDFKVKVLSKNDLLTLSSENLSPNSLSLKEVKLIKLKENQFSEIVILEKVIQTKDRLIISDKMANKAIFFYDLNGDFHNHIYSKGEGPGEFKFINAIAWDELQEKLLLVPMHLQKEMIFDTNGYFVEEIKQNPSLSVNDFVLFNDDRLILNSSYMNSDHNVILLKGNGDFESFVEFNSKLDHSIIINENSIYKYGDKAIFSLTGRDTIFEFDYQAENVVAKFVVDYGSRKFPQEHFNLSYDEQLKRFVDSDLLVGINNVFVAGNYMTYSGLSPDGFETFIYDLERKRLHSLESLLTKHLDGGVLERIVGANENGEFIGLLNTKDIKKIKEIQPVKKNFEQFEDVEREDKVLVFFSLK